MSKLNDIEIVLSLLNKGRSLSEICKEISCSNYYRLSRLIQRLLRREIVSKHYVFPLEILPEKIRLIAVSKNQKTVKPCFNKPIKTIVRYYSYTGRPVELYYSMDDCYLVENNVNPTICRVEICETIYETLLPIENIEDSRYVFTPLSESDQGVVRDSFDVNILLDVFRLSNPPYPGLHRVTTFTSLIAKRLGLSSIKYHYYSHIHNFIRSYYAMRNQGDFLLIHIQSPSLREAEDCLVEMNKTGLISGPWLVLSTGAIPVNVFIHTWGFIDRFLDPRSSSHGFVENTSYFVYPIIGVDHGYG